MNCNHAVYDDGEHSRPDCRSARPRAKLRRVRTKGAVRNFRRPTSTAKARLANHVLTAWIAKPRRRAKPLFAESAKQNAAIRTNLNGLDYKP